MKLNVPSRREHGDPIIPLINVIFLLVIFFMVAGTIAPTPALDVRPPTSKADGELAQAADIILGLDGRVAVGEQVADLTAARSLIERHLAAGEGPIAITADQDVPAEMLLELLATIRSLSDRPTILTVRGDK